MLPLLPLVVAVNPTLSLVPIQLVQTQIQRVRARQYINQPGNDSNATIGIIVVFRSS